MNERIFKPLNGLLFVFIFFAVVAGLIFSIVSDQPFITIVLGLTMVIILKGFFIVQPNESNVLVLFGKYIGTVKDNGFFWANPLLSHKRLSLRARNFDSERLKVNDKRGNPIIISAILVWKVSETYKTAFEIDDYQQFVKVQTDAAVRKLAGLYSYDNFEDEHEAEVTLRSGVLEVNEAMEREISERLSIAGLEVLEARIGYLAYAEEIASAMLKRQQAEAIVAARHKIVEGAVSMVESALAQLEKRNIVDLDDDKKATMVSNLLVVLCSDKETTPVVNTGTLYR